jgi:DNA-directed RNA polymerase II subunit RPB2
MKEVKDLLSIPLVNLGRYTKIFVNGNWSLCTDNPVEVRKKLVEARRKILISVEASLIYDAPKGEMRIYTDAGRLVRLLYVVDQPGNRLRMNKKMIEKLKDGKVGFDDLLREGYVEFVEIHEGMYNILVAMTLEDLYDADAELIKYTHCEIHPQVMFSPGTCLIPWPDHNQSPRNMFQLQMQKQTLGVPTITYQQRLDSAAFVLWYPERPLISNVMDKYTGFNIAPAGVNLLVAIACFEGYNKEDAIIVNKRTYERGALQATMYKTYEDELSVNNEDFVKPEKDKTDKYNYNSDYSNLEEDGMPRIGSAIKKSDIIIGKVQKLDKTEKDSNNQFEYKDRSKQYKDFVPGVIDKIFISDNADEAKFAKVRVRQTRVPVLGDKLAGRNGQKGTIGMIYPAEDLPFDEDGYIPDLIVNPNAQVSRMTVGMLKEIFMGQVCARRCRMSDSSPFMGVTVEDIIKEAKEIGLNPKGTRYLYDPKTGRKQRYETFMGPIFYQPLKHKTQDKIFSRSTGPYERLSRQPNSGRATGGAIRCGEIEIHSVSVSNKMLASWRRCQQCS